ncbi:MAG: hypothetical protein AABW83_03305 [Nanoarchaeota archaeon]
MKKQKNIINFEFKINNKKFKIKTKKCETIYSQISGLMFKKNSPSLLFKFKKPKSLAIHSFFCKKFMAIWFLKDKIVDIKIIIPNKLSIKPKNKFDKILEIPSDSKYFNNVRNVENLTIYGEVVSEHPKKSPFERKIANQTSAFRQRLRFFWDFF